MRGPQRAMRLTDHILGRKKNDKTQQQRRGHDRNLASAPTDLRGSRGGLRRLVAIAALAASLIAVNAEEAPLGDEGFSEYAPFWTSDLVKEATEMAKNFTCSKPCRGRTQNERLPPEKLDELKFSRFKCYCDEDCHLFSDCCADIVGADSSSTHVHHSDPRDNSGVTPEDIISADEKVKKFMGIPVHQWGCHEVKKPRIGIKKWAYMVESCPEDYWDTNVVTMCSRREEIPSEEYSYLLDLPVISSTTGVPYVNSFCMTCNEDEAHSVESPFYQMKLKFTCTENNAKEEHTGRESVYLKDQRMWLVDGQNCTLEIVDPEKVFFGTGKDLDPERPGNYTRRCVQSVDTCSNEALSKLCSMYDLHVQAQTSRGLKVYKNPHCAFCHGRRREDLKCTTISIRPVFKYNMPKIKTIFEIRWDGGAILNEGSRKRCSLHHMWDVVKKRCVAFACRRGEVLSGGRCEAKVEQTSEAYPWDATSDGGNSSGRDPGGEGGNMTEAASPPPDIHSVIQGYLMMTCMSLSVFFLIIHIIIYSFVPKLRNLPGRNLLALSWALLLAQFVVLLSGNKMEGPAAHWICFSAAVVIHYFYLSAVFWMNVMSVDVWRTFSSSSSRHHRVGNRDSSRRLHARYSAYAWGVPLVLTVLSLAIDMVPSSPGSTLSLVQPAYGRTSEDMCWLSGSVGAAIFFTVPTIILLLANAGLFARSVFKIHENQESRRYMRKKAMEEETLCNQRVSKVAESEATTETAEVHGIVPKRPFRRPDKASSCISGKDKSRLYLYVKLATIMGLSWICGFVAALADIKELWYPFILLNGLQGAFIFFMFDVKWKVVGMIVERITGNKPDWASSSSSSTKWPIFRSTMSWGRRARNRKNTDYAGSTLGKFSPREKTQSRSSRTTSTSMPNSSDVEICNLPGGPNPVLRPPGPTDFTVTESLQVTGNLLTSTPINGVPRV